MEPSFRLHNTNKDFIEVKQNHKYLGKVSLYSLNTTNNKGNESCIILLTPSVLFGSSMAFFAASTVLYVTKPKPLHYKLRRKIWSVKRAPYSKGNTL